MFEKSLIDRRKLLLGLLLALSLLMFAAAAVVRSSGPHGGEPVDLPPIMTGGKWRLPYLVNPCDRLSASGRADRCLQARNRRQRPPTDIPGPGIIYVRERYGFVRPPAEIPGPGVVYVGERLGRTRPPVMIPGPGYPTV